MLLTLVPAGDPVDDLLRTLSPYLDEVDVFIHAFISYYQDINCCLDTLEKKNIHFVGMGVSGGEEGARHGPSLMPGGDPSAWERIRPLLEAAAAKVEGEACVGW